MDYDLWREVIYTSENLRQLLLLYTFIIIIYFLVF